MTRLALILALSSCVSPAMDDCHASASGLHRLCGGDHHAEKPEPPEKPKPDLEPNRETDPKGWRDWKDRQNG